MTNTVHCLHFGFPAHQNEDVRRTENSMNPIFAASKWDMGILPFSQFVKLELQVRISIIRVLHLHIQTCNYIQAIFDYKIYSQHSIQHVQC